MRRTLFNILLAFCFTTGIPLHRVCNFIGVNVVIVETISTNDAAPLQYNKSHSRGEMKMDSSSSETFAVVCELLITHLPNSTIPAVCIISEIICKVPGTQAPFEHFHGCLGGT